MNVKFLYLKTSASQADSDIVGMALQSTLNWLETSKKQVVLIGPVPVFDRNVPMALALEKATGKHFLQSSFEQQMKLHAGFFKAIASIGSKDGVTFLDPIEWLCKPICTAQIAGAPIYRDAHHLSVFGAQMLGSKLKDGVLGVRLAAKADSVKPVETP